LFPASALAVILGFAPQQADFSGMWTATTDAPRDIPAAPSPVLGRRFHIEQTAGTVVLTRIGTERSFPVEMAIGGPETRWRVPGSGCQADFERIDKIEMEGPDLIHTMVGFVPAGASEPRLSNVKYRIRHEAPDTISVQGTLVQDGKQQRVATVYRRSMDAPPAPPASDLPPVEGTPARIAQAEWIGATWIGSAANGVTVEERWTPAGSGTMLGIGRTARGQQMGSFEFLCITERAGSLVYFAMPNGRTPATPFVLTSVTAAELTFENPTHDFPKLVRYARTPDGSLQTTISAGPGTRETSYTLKKQ
jgi:hypothetical protein